MVTRFLLLFDYFIDLQVDGYPPLVKITIMTDAKPSIQKSISHPSTALTNESSNLEGFSNRLINAVIIILTVFAFIPILLDSRFYESRPRFIISIVLGALYGLAGTSRILTHTSFHNRVGLFIYFGLQISILAGIFWLGRDFDNNFWLLMLPIAAQGIALGLFGALLIGLIEIFVFWAVHWSQLPFADYANGLFSIATGMTFTVLFTMIALREQSGRIETERLAHDLRLANHRLAEYATQVEELAIVSERNRLAREIHDNLGHYLTVVNIQIEAARTIMNVNPQKADDALLKAQTLTQDGLTSVRKSVSALRASPLDERPLPEAISQLAEENQSTGISTHLTTQGEAHPLDPKIELTLYRTVQESLTNVRKHAHASRVDILLDYRNEEMIQLSIQDNGVGTEKTDGGFGLLGLKERVQLLNGTLTIQSEPNSGFLLTIQIPTALIHKESTL